MFWFVLFTFAITHCIPPLRRRWRAFGRYILAEGARVFCLVLLAFAISATALNSRGIPPTSLPGTMMMSLIFWIGGALMLRWLETRRR